MAVSPVFFAPLLLVPFFPAEAPLSVHFAGPGLALLMCGFGLCRLGPGKEGRNGINEREGSIVILFTWITVSLAGAWPVAAAAGLDFPRSLFESVSGWTTTGLSVIDLSSAPETLLLFRSVTQLAGAMGITIVLASSFTLPVGAGLFRSEARWERYSVRLARAVKVVAGLYLAYCAAGILGLRIGGMRLTDALNHSMAAVSTGGFSTRSGSIGSWDSPVIEAVTIPLMVFGGFSAFPAYALLHGKPKRFFRHKRIGASEALLSGALIAVLSILAAGGLYAGLGGTLRVAVFETVSALTTTGFTITGGVHRSPAAVSVILVLMLVGGGACSAAGGIKLYRVYLLIRAVGWEVKRTLLPRHAVYVPRFGNAKSDPPIEPERLPEAGVFTFLYIVCLLTGVVVMTAHGIDLETALFEFASALGTVGLSAGATSASAPDAVLWIEIAGMFLGRLEFFIVFTALGHLVRSLGHRS